MSFSPFTPYLQESPAGYSPFPLREPVYEIALKTAGTPDGLKYLQDAHRLVQALLQGDLLGDYKLLDFMLWPEGLFTRVSLRNDLPLAEFLKFLRERSTPPGRSPSDFWEEELRWIRLIPPENLEESTRFFLERADLVRRDVSRSHGFSPNLFFLYRDPKISR